MLHDRALVEELCVRVCVRAHVLFVCVGLPDAALVKEFCNVLPGADGIDYGLIRVIVGLRAPAAKNPVRGFRADVCLVPMHGSFVDANDVIVVIDFLAQLA